MAYGRLYGALCTREGGNLSSQNRLDEGERDFRKAITIQQALISENPAVPVLLTDLVHSYAEWVRFAPSSKGLRLLQEACAAVEVLPREGHSLFALARLLALRAETADKTQSAVADEARRRKDAGQAVDALRRAVDAGFRDTGAIQGSAELAKLRQRDDVKELVKEMGRATKFGSAGTGRDSRTPAKRASDGRSKPPNPTLADLRRYRADLAASQHATGLVQLSLGDRDEAEKSLTEALRDFEALAREEPKTPRHRLDLASTHLALGDLARDSLRLPEALRSWTIGRDLLIALLKDLPRDDSLAGEVRKALLDLGDYLSEHYLWDEAARALGPGLEAGDAPGFMV